MSPDQKRETDRQLAFGFWQRTIEAAAAPPEPEQQESPRERELQSRQMKL